MRPKKFTFFLLPFFFLFAIVSCNKSETFETEALADYLPLTVGKYITYRVDSMVFTSFGRVVEIHKYQIKHIVDAAITDNEGRSAYRILAYIRDSVNASSWTPAQPWTNSYTYYITPLKDQIEVSENNLRFIKLHLPVRSGFSWNGNKYLPDDPYSPVYNFSNDDAINTWDYTYGSFLPTFSYRGVNYSNIYPIDHIDEENLVDTFRVDGASQVAIPANKSSAWITGNATGPITINAAASNNGFEMRLYNYSNYLLKLNDIPTPVGYSRNYEYRDGQWRFGDNGKDTLYTDPPYGSKNYSSEKYSKGIGLVYRENEMWEYQPNISGAGGGYKTGFGIKMWMIDHN